MHLVAMIQCKVEAAAAVKHCIIAESTLVGFRRPVTWFASTTRTLFKRKRCLLMMKCIFKENLVDYFWDE